MPRLGFDVVKPEAGAALERREAAGDVHLVREEQERDPLVLHVCWTASQQRLPSAQPTAQGNSSRGGVGRGGAGRRTGVGEQVVQLLLGHADAQLILAVDHKDDGLQQRQQ